MSLFHPLRPPGRRRRWRPVAATVAAAALAGTVLAPSASATTDPLPHDQSSTFYSWGTNYNAQIGNGTSPNPYATYTPQSISLPGGVATVEASVGYQFDVALGADGQIYTWGDDGDEELGDTTSGVRTSPQAISLPGGVLAVSVAAGNNYGLAVGVDGQVYWWGTQRGTGQGPQQLPTAVPLPGGDLARSVEIFDNASVAFGVDGKVFVWGQNYSDTFGTGDSQNILTPQQFVLPGGDGVASLAFGEGFGLAIGTDGKLFSWGEMSQYGVLGDGGTAAVETPTQISLPGEVPAVAVATGGLDALAIGADGRVYTWGTQSRGELGNGVPGYEVELSPEAITLPDGVLASSIGATFGTPSVSFAVGQNGEVYTWGNNGLGVIGDGTTTSRPTPAAVAIPDNPYIGSVAAGPYVMLAIPGSSTVTQPPVFVSHASPLLEMLAGSTYSAYFPATGSPTYSLVDAPDWLTVTDNGAVVGTPPAGTTSFSYTVAADNTLGQAEAGPFTVTVDPAVAVTGTVLDQRFGTAVSGAAVQACVAGAPAGSPCPETTTAADGSYNLAASVGSSVVLTAFPPPSSGATTTSTVPLPVPADGIQGETITLTDTSTLPAGVKINGAADTPTFTWASPALASASGCADGIAAVSVIGQNSDTGAYQASVTPLTETEAGSGAYTGNIPPQTPVHGPVEIDSGVQCPDSGSVQPSTGAAAGGDDVVVFGAGFTDATGVMFGSTPAAGFTVLDDNDIEATAPPGTGSVAVSVQVGGTSSVIGTYTYMRVSSLAPTTGSADGGTPVVITGSGLSRAGEVLFGSTAASFTQVSDTEIDATSPPGSGAQDVTVENLYGQVTAVVPADQFTYTGTSSQAEAAAVKRLSADAVPLPAVSSAATAATARTAKAAKANALAPADSSALPTTLDSIIKYASEYVPYIPGLPKYVNALAQSAEEAVKPSCAQGEAATVAAILTYWQGPIAAFGNVLGLAIGYGLPTLLASTGVGALADVAIMRWLTRTPAGEKVLTKVGTFIANAMAGYAALAAAKVLFAVYCHNSKPNADAYIDPSGTVLDTNGNPVTGATVTILRGDTAAGPFTALDPTKPGIEPAVNPQTTGSDGVFDWDVYAGWYEIQATAPGCTDPGDSTKPTATIGPYPVPPPQIGLTLTMSCPGNAGPPTPTVASLSTSTGPAAGGTTLTILGTGFTPASTVDFGTSAGTAVTYLSAQALTVTAPPGTGTVDVTVDNAGTSSATSSADQFLYGSPPTVTGLDTSSGPVTGGTTVTINGTGFTGADQVEFGNAPATSFTVVSDTEIQATTPAETSGTVDVYVDTPAGVSAQGSADQYTYTAVPVVFTADTPPTTATVGQPYSFTYTASGTPAPTFSVSSGALPPGLSLNSTTGVLSGTPTTAGPYTFAVMAANGLETAAVSPSTAITVGNPPGPAIDRQATITGMTAVTANLSTASSGDLIVAFVAGDGPTGANQKAKVTGGGLTWTLAKRTNGQSGTAEIWTARATGALSNAAITSTLTTTGYGEALTVVAFTNAPGTGQTAGASKAKGAPMASLTTTVASSWVFAVGDDWTASVPRTVGPNQTLVAQSNDSRGDTYWVQSTVSPTPTAGTTVTINDTAPTTDNWNLALIEID